MTIAEYIASRVNAPAGLELSWVALVIAKLMNADPGSDNRWDADCFDSDNPYATANFGPDGMAWMRELLERTLDRVAAAWASCDAPDNLEQVLDALSDIGWDFWHERTGDKSRLDEYGDAAVEACQHVLNLSYGYRWFRRINGEDPEFNAEFGYGGAPGGAVDKLGAAAREALDRLIAESPETKALEAARDGLAELLEWAGNTMPNAGDDKVLGPKCVAAYKKASAALTLVREALEGRNTANAN